MTKLLINFIKLFSITFLLAAVSSCTNEKDDLTQYINEIKSRAPKKIEPIPEFTSLPDFQYPENLKRRSPFEPIKAAVDHSAAPDQNRPKQPLESYGLDALKFVGTLEQDHHTWALILQPDGNIARIRAGDYMGKNYGKVIKVTPSKLTLKETVRVAGQWQQKITEIKLYIKPSGR